MKPFRFRLETLLTLREREEERKREAMSYAEDRRNRAEQSLANGEAALAELDRALMTQRQGRLNCRDHLLMLHAMDMQRVECKRLANVLRQSTAEVESKRADLVEAKREHDVVLRLKEKQLTEYRKEVARQEELEIGDMIGARHALKLAEHAA